VNSENQMNAKDYFDNAAETWDSNFQTLKLFSFLEKLVPQFSLHAGQHVLDVGTGTGVLIPYLIKSVGPSGSVTALDFSEKMIQKCKLKYSRIQNVTIKVGSIEDADFPTELFDAVICFGAFPHIDRKGRALLNICRILKPGGKLFIAHALSSEELKLHHRKVSEHIAESELPERSEMTKLLKQTGFVRPSIKDEPGCYLCIANKPCKP
jgi:ubiquinone/menaquinone biosynthesis C-methylase UbiE